jgi:hypothetical protein
MDKKGLIGFILNDIKELELIVKGMHEMDKIPEVMQELAISKTQNILDKFYQLKENFQKDVLTTTDNFLIFDEKTETIQQEEIFSGEIEKAELEKEEKVPEQIEPQEENIVEPVEEETAVSQKIESKEEKVFFQSSLLFVEEEGKPEEEIQPLADQQPEEEKGTIVVDEEKKVQERTTNEKFKFRIPVVNPAVATGGRRIESRFVQNLRKAINLNDKFRYQKELFGGNVELMNKVIDQLDAMGSLEEAMTYVQQEFAWDAESGTVADFYLLLESRFS